MKLNASTESAIGRRTRRTQLRVGGCIPTFYGPIVSTIVVRVLVEQRVVKGERKGHRPAGSKSDSPTVRSDKLSLGAFRCAGQAKCCVHRDLKFDGARGGNGTAVRRLPPRTAIPSKSFSASPGSITGWSHWT
jgi:hypothetical protein